MTRPKTTKPDAGNRDSARVMGARGTVSQQGSGGGRLALKKGSRDELKRATERPAGATRVRKADREDQ
ncbi:MAG: hypothetical protein MUE98_06235 [Rhodobacteraceae bacterium]|jgi:hypothetical protein|nr:hypothetical protein [Paracoccaceae bacterium]